MSENQIGMNGLERELEERKVRAFRRGHSVNSLNDCYELNFNYCIIFKISFVSFFSRILHLLLSFLKG